MVTPTQTTHGDRATVEHSDLAGRPEERTAASRSREQVRDDPPSVVDVGGLGDEAGDHRRADDPAACRNDELPDAGLCSGVTGAQTDDFAAVVDRR
jgi:hypothetical protein